MKKVLSITILTSILSVFSLNNHAFANGPGSARFDFAPNVWGGGVQSAGTPEPVMVKKRAAVWQPPKVAHYASTVPHNNAFLGLDNESLAARAPRVAPIATTTVAAVPSFAQALPSVMSAKPLNVQFKSVFGKPISANVAAPKVAMAHSLPAVSSTCSAKLASKSINHSIIAKVAHAKRLSVPSDAYGQNFGYMTSQAFSGSGFKTSTNVKAQIIQR